MSNSHSSIGLAHPGALPRSLALAVMALQRAAAAVLRMRDDWRERRRVHDTHFALQQLDDRTLRDLGIHRSEISSLVGEAFGHIPSTRARFLDPAHGLYR